MTKSSENHPTAGWNHPIRATVRPAPDHPRFIRLAGLIIRRSEETA